jgi:D-glycero-D-manno-heptose 1,7-bisphosphate phosphatase
VGDRDLNKRRAIFLDRDGVLINAKFGSNLPNSARTIAEVVLLPQVEEALDLLQLKGYLCLVFTNQPDIARGIADEDEIAKIHKFLLERLNLNKIFMCPHDEADECLCRKPKPGMILAAASEFNINLKESYVVGDRWRDIEAGQACNCKCFFIDYQYPERQPIGEFTRVKSLLEVANLLPEVNHREIC